jgi:hypothetical protein
MSLGLGDLFKIVRCGLVHEYFMKVESVVSIGGTGTSNCGIMYNHTDSPPLRFDVSQYFSDFKIAFDKYYNELIGTSNLKEKPTLESNFDLAVNSMPFKPFDKSTSSPTRYVGASGKHP